MPPALETWPTCNQKAGHHSGYCSGSYPSNDSTADGWSPADKKADRTDERRTRRAQQEADLGWATHLIALGFTLFAALQATT